MIRRLRIKFVCINMAIVLVMLCAMFLTVYLLTRQNMERRSVEFLRSAAEDPGMLQGTEDARIHPPYLVVEVGGNGTVRILSAGGFQMEDGEQLEDLARLAASGGAGTLQEYNLRYYSLTMPEARRLAFADMSGERWAMEGVMQNCILIACVSLVMFFFISVFLARWAVRPVEEAWKGQRQFVADASHELKTPLTVILANADMLQGSGGLTGQTRQRVENIAAESHQMRGLVESLLELARADSGIPREQMSALDFSAMTERALLTFEAVFFENGHPLQGEITPGLWVLGSSRHLSQVVEILLDNANKYAAPGGAVEVGLRQEDRGRCLLWVRSQGPAIAQEDLERIFRRFYRTDTVRSSGGSYGLGLSIADGIVREHRGKIWAESGPEKNTFYVRLPLERDRQTSVS